MRRGSGCTVFRIRSDPALFGRTRIRSNGPAPNPVPNTDPTIKSRNTINKSSKLNRYFSKHYEF